MDILGGLRRSRLQSVINDPKASSGQKRAAQSELQGLERTDDRYRTEKIAATTAQVQGALLAGQRLKAKAEAEASKSNFLKGVEGVLKPGQLAVLGRFDHLSGVYAAETAKRAHHDRTPAPPFPVAPQISSQIHTGTHHATQSDRVVDWHYFGAVPSTHVKGHPIANAQAGLEAMSPKIN